MPGEHSISEAVRRRYGVVPPNCNLEQVVRNKVFGRGGVAGKKPLFSAALFVVELTQIIVLA